MDAVRFGRVLGIGARLAAKTAVTAVDAALAPNPNVPATTGTTTVPGAPHTAFPERRSSGVAKMGKPAATTSSHSPRQVRHLTNALSAPIRRLSGVLWFELTGLFFGLFAFSAAVGAWRLHRAWHATPANTSDHVHLLLSLAIALLFAYFSASSFLRARRRNRQG